MSTPTDYNYTISTGTVNGIVDTYTLSLEIKNSTDIAIQLQSVITDGDDLTVTFYDALPSAQETSLNSLVAAHEGESTPVNTIPLDTDGTPLSRVKMAPQGWAYQSRALELTTSTLSSLVNEKYDLTDWADGTIKFYDSSDNELTTQVSLDTSCTKTVVDWEPSYDYELIGGFVTLGTGTSSDVRIWVVAVPDLTEAQGGSKIFINNISLKFLNGQDRIIVDGRVSKRLNYNTTYHTNKLRLIIAHPAGAKCDIMWALEHYKA